MEAVHPEELDDRGGVLNFSWRAVSSRRSIWATALVTVAASTGDSSSFFLGLSTSDNEASSMASLYFSVSSFSGLFASLPALMR